MSTYAHLHAIATREALRVELNLALNAINAATHAVIGTHDRVVYHYGSRTTCEAFTAGIERTCRVTPMTPAIRERQTAAKIKAYRGG